MNGTTISLQGSPEQVRELHKAMVAYKCILLSLGGNEMSIDLLIEPRLQKVNFWIEECEKSLP